MNATQYAYSELRELLLKYIFSWKADSSTRMIEISKMNVTVLNQSTCPINGEISGYLLHNIFLKIQGVQDQNFRIQTAITQELYT